MPIEIHKGSILDCDVDVIVNPANSFLRHGGGLARIIDEAARGVKLKGPHGPKFHDRTLAYDHAHKAAPLIPTGGIHTTPAGVLPFQWIIHAVGPIWGGGNFMETDLYEILHEQIFNEATENLKVSSIALPAISCGIFGMPVGVAARISVQVANWFEDLRIVFALMDDEHVTEYENQIAALDRWSNTYAARR